MKHGKVNVFLYFSALSANLATFTAGGCFGWSSPAIPILNGQLNTTVNPLGRPIDQYEESWIGSLLLVGAAIACFISGCLADRLGRKRTLMVFMLPTMAGFVVDAFASDVAHFYAGRILNGFGVGASYTLTPMYLGEIAEKSNRGVLGCFCLLFAASGATVVFCIGPYVSIMVMSLMNLVPPAVFLIVFGVMVPESPYYHIMKNDPIAAAKSLRKLRCNGGALINEELAEIKKNVAEAREGRLKDLFYKRGLLKGLSITVGLLSFQQFSGVNFVFFYLQSIFEKTGSSIPSDVSSIIIGFDQAVAVVVASLLVDRLGRRILLSASALGMAVFSVCFGSYFYLKEAGRNVDDIYWLPIVSVILFVFTFAIGFGPLPLGMIGEIFPPHVKSFAATLSIFFYLVWAFLVTTFFPLIANAVGMSYTFFACAGLSLVGCAFVYFFVPETKGKSFSEIQDALRS